MLRSRIFRRVAFAPLSAADVAKAIPLYHPIWRDADKELIVGTDRTAAHGRLRTWAAITHTAAEICQRTGLECATKEIVKAAVTKIGAGS